MDVFAKWSIYMQNKRDKLESDLIKKKEMLY